MLFILAMACAPCSLQAQNATRLIAQGDSLLEAGRTAKAMEKYNAAVLLAPNADALAARAKGWFFQGKSDKFLRDSNASLALDSLHPQANYQRALHAFQTGDQAAAVRFATRALKSATKPALRRRILLLRGEAAATAGQKENAISDLTAGIDDRLDEWPAMKLLARLLDETGNPNASLQLLEKLCSVQPNDIGNWSNKGFELNTLERYADAVKAFDMALTIDKDEPVVLSNKAFALMKLGQTDEAFTNVNRSIKADGTNPYALRTRAMLFLRKGEGQKACNDLSLAKAMGGAPEVDELIKQNCQGIQPKR